MLSFAYSPKKVAILIAILFISISAKSQLVFDKHDYQIDKNLHLIICNRIPDKIPDNTLSISFDKVYTFYAPIDTIQIGIPYSIFDNDTIYKLYFTRLPIVNLIVKNTIGDDYSGGTLSISDTIGDPINSTMGIKLRGALSRTYPKKSYHIQLWSDSTGTETQNKSFFGMRNDQTWLLLAMYDEKLRLNNKVSHDLWLKLHKLYYADQEPDAHSTIRSRYIEAFLNDDYQGVYLFTEDTDRKQLQLKKQTISNAGGELYKSYDWTQETVFTGVSSLPSTPTEDWGGWELDYPDTTNWINLHQFIDFAVNSSDSLFKQQISAKIRQDNFADYFIFLNLIRATDNFGKNLFLARYKPDEPYFIVPWDLDGTWGYLWDGNTNNITNDILSNNLFNRLLAIPSFKLQLATRWFALRSNILSIDSLSSSINNSYNFLISNGVYERESLKWANPFLSYSAEELDYIHTWTQNRVNYLDNYFKSLVQDQPIIYSFTAEAIEKKAVLNWTVNCAAVNSFDVEQSTDSLTWSTISVAPILSNDSLPCQYTFTDNNPSSGNSYYRLKITNKQNSSSYSAIQLLNFDLPVNVFPNPASTTLQVQGNIDKVDVYSLRGALIYESTNASPNLVNVNSFSSGTYLLRVTQKNGTVSTHKILVNR
ncbi:T9SS type A sorting domain-containing protein [Spirosoma sp. HMF4905]|uniref:T9SS type A sorting domain-containing protein n=1 Tax=Spirosoma arboris TaxID=2682092 RepID=A0A7K1S7V2_9BACT|nr:CotH kinase family protein [Spirosoma arboris]MVM29698.1 T9SS type A sorting domain-containing protein [Spirosoma arboris]